MRARSASTIRVLVVFAMRVVKESFAGPPTKGDADAVREHARRTVARREAVGNMARLRLSLCTSTEERAGEL
jgi:hypothetical protein